MAISCHRWRPGYGIPEKGDPNWVDARGSFMAAVLAGPAYRLLGKKDLISS